MRSPASPSFVEGRDQTALRRLPIVGLRIKPQFALRRSWKDLHERRNWLFSDTVGGAQASANLYSLIQTALANDVDPYRYLRLLFARLPSATTVDDYEALLPWHFKRDAPLNKSSQP